MNHTVVSREERVLARKELLEAEKAHTRRSDELANWRQELPWVKIETSYQFETELGCISLQDMFQGRTQLMVYHFMFGPEYKTGCPSCSMIADGFNGLDIHWANHDVAFWAISRTPYERLQAYQKRMQWTFPWASSWGSQFNYDFGVSFTENEQFTEGIDYNYRREPALPYREVMSAIPSRNTPDGPTIGATMSGTDVASYTRERPGMSSFVLEDDVVYHTYSTFGRGLDILWNSYQWLDRAPKGRNETGMWWRRHDEYDATPSASNSCCHDRPLE